MQTAKPTKSRFPGSNTLARAAALYLAAALLFTWPIARHPLTLLASTRGPGDAFLNLWILGWDLQAVLHHPLSILSGRVFDANIFYPATGTLTYSDHLLLQAVALSPIYGLTGSLVFCYNVLLVGSLALSALAMHAFVREAMGRSPAAWMAGLAWGFAPYHFAHLIHLQLQSLYFLPLTFLFLHRTALRRRRRDAWWLGLTLAAQALSSAYYGLIGGIAVVLAASIYMFAAGWPGAWQLARRLALAAALSSMIVAPVVLKYRLVQQREGFGRSLHEASLGSAATGSYLEIPETNLVYGRSGILHSHDPDDQAHKASEQNLFPGFMVMGLAAIGLLSVRRQDRRTLTIALAVVGVTGVVLSLGPDGLRSLYGFFYQYVFGFQAVRAPARFSVLVLFALAGLGAFGVDEVLVRRPGPSGPGIIFALIMALMAIEYANAPIRYAAAPAIETPAGQWLRANQEPGAVVYLPLGLDPASNSTFMVRSLAHGRSIVNGYSGERPSFFPALVDTMAQFPSAESVRTLLDFNVRFVVAQAPIAPSDLRLVERARFADAVVYEIRDSPELDSALALPETPPLPQPASIPFAIGERATYSVVWASGPLSLPAGQIVMDVAAGRDGAAYELAASGTTADWVSRFFEANDRFVSQVDRDLRPLVFEQHLKEGRRQVDRRAVFDRAARVVRVQQGSGPELSLPISLDALDPLALFYYARTVPLMPGSSLQIPMHDTNRNLVVALRIDALETISYNGVPTPAVRTTPQIRRVGGPAAAQLTVWFSRDPSQMPLRVEIAGLAGVGAVRLELESVR